MLRGKWRQELPLILAALFISFVIWLMAKQSTLESDRLQIAVTVENQPANVILDWEPARVLVIVNFPQSQRNAVTSQNFVARLDAAELFGSEDPREWEYDESGVAVVDERLVLDNIHASDLPESIRVTEPSAGTRIRVRATLRTRSLPILVDPVGALSAKYDLREPPRVEPVEVLVTASEAVLAALDREETFLMTQPVSLDGRIADFIEFTELNVPSNLQLVNEEQRSVEVHVGIMEKETSRKIAGVPIKLFLYAEGLEARIKPAVTEVEVRGKFSAIGQLDEKSFVFWAKETLTEREGIQKEIELEIAFGEDVPPEVWDKVEIVGPKPLAVEVEIAKSSEAAEAAPEPNPSESESNDGNALR